MFATLVISLLFFAVGTVELASGIFTLQSNHKAPANRLFFLLATSIAIWTAGIAMSVISTDISVSIAFRRIAAIGWSTVYAIWLHFTLVITGRSSSRKKWWQYVLLYLPALVVLLFSSVFPNVLHPSLYNLQHTEHGWVNTARHSLWDWVFCVYYIGYSLVGLWYLYRWSNKASDQNDKRKARIILLSISSALVLGTITDVVLGSLFPSLPQMAPAIMLIPILAIYHVLQRDSFGIVDAMERRTSYVVLFISVLLYIILTAMQELLFGTAFVIGPVYIEKFVLSGVIVQIQMFLSIYLELKENRPGYITAIMMNLIGLFSAIAYSIRNETTTPLPGIIGYLNALLVITLIKAYKDKNAAYIKKINTQAVREEFYSNIFKQSPVGIAIMSDNEFFKSEELDDVSINPSLERILGRSKDELKSMDWTQITHPDDLETDLKYFEDFKSGKADMYSREKRYIKPDGSVVWIDMQISRFNSPNHNPGDHVCIITDITQRKEIEAALKYSSEHMPITGLYNRSVLERTLENDASLPSSVKRALISINLSEMQTLSLRYGYHFNQSMLKRIADSLKSFCNDRYSLFNTHEYRFAYYVKDYADEKELVIFCEKILKTLASYLYVHGVGTGIGILQIDESLAHDPKELLDKLMNTSEVAVRNMRNNSNILFYSHELDFQITRENKISMEIREIAGGIGTDRLYLQFQPIYDIALDKICGFEALARLNDQKLGLISPLEFIPIAEKTNMIVPFGEKIIQKALSFLIKLKENGFDELTVTINISVLQMLADQFADKLLDMIDGMQVNPENVGIELTESVFATERKELNTVIGVLKTAGIKVLIDDFGTGYSSFAREQELNIDCLKIDKSFIDKLLVLEPEEAVTADIISMAHKLGHCVVAEGVEHEKQFRYLQDFGCDRIQGYLIAKPLNEEDALGLLKEQLQSP